MKNERRPKPPRTLSPEARRWWKRLMNEYTLDDTGALLLLEVALTSFDEMRAAEKIIKEEGLITTTTTTNARHLHPAAAVVRDARLGMLRALKALNLDVDPPRPGTGRPPGSGMVG